MLTRIHPPTVPVAVTICSCTGHILGSALTVAGQWPEEIASALYQQAHPVYTRFKIASNVTCCTDSLYGMYELEIGRDGVDGIVWLDDIVMHVDPVVS